jgi:hypothetical protein
MPGDRPSGLRVATSPDGPVAVVLLSQRADLHDRGWLIPSLAFEGLSLG